MHSYQAAPTTERDMAKPIPRFAHINGEVSVKNLQTQNEMHEYVGYTRYCITEYKMKTYLR